jgi:hypothetical protein
MRMGNVSPGKSPWFARVTVTKSLSLVVVKSGTDPLFVMDPPLTYAEDVVFS